MPQREYQRTNRERGKKQRHKTLRSPDKMKRLWVRLIAWFKYNFEEPWLPATSIFCGIGLGQKKKTYDE